MILDPSENLSTELRHFYNKLVTTITGEKIRIINESIFITFLKCLPTEYLNFYPIRL